MATGRALTISGLDVLKNALEQAPERLRRYAAAAVETTTFSAAQRVRTLAPRDTGRLKAAVSAATKDLNGRVLIAADAYYWRFIEYGSVRSISALGGRTYNVARPFVRPAAEEETAPFTRLMEEVAEKVARDLSVSRFL